MEILVLFDSKGGNTYALAKAVAEGIEQVEGMKERFPCQFNPIHRSFNRIQFGRGFFQDRLGVGFGVRVQGCKANV